MPRPTRELKGRTFGRLKPIRLVADRDAHGRRQWLCKCSCARNRSVVVPALYLLSGHTRSCGCLKREKDKRRRLPRWAYVKKDVVDDGGRDWFPSRLAQRYVRVSETTLTNWSRRCAWLGGRALKTRLLPDAASGRRTVHYLKDDLDAINDARAERLPVPASPGTIPVRNAAVAVQCHPAHVRRWRRQAGEPINLADGKDKLGRASRRSTVAASLVTKLIADKRTDPKPADEMTVAELAELLGTDTAGAFRFISRTGIKGRIGKAICRTGFVRSGMLLLPRAKVDAAMRRDTAEAKTASTDASRFHAREKHRKWQQWKTAGMSYSQIAIRHRDETGDDVTADAVKKALKRLPAGGDI